MKRVTLSIAMTVLLGLGAMSVAGAQGPGRGQGQGPGRGPDGGGGRGAMMMLRGLDLTESQQEQIRAIREAQPAPAAGTAEGGLHRQLQAELLADVPDMQKLADLQARIAEAQSARLAHLVTVQQQIAQVLTAEQRATLRERLAQTPDQTRQGRPAGRRPAPRN
ncbi:MAG: Spy/CpxP family protein refolding chaperone [Acidobacteria bacterium]|nr:Spy/CpxP family protein refolding chaperone [Acidobacteriota bacterium]